MMPRQRVRLIVEVDLDPVPGWGDNAADWEAAVSRMLTESMPHYNPTVVVDCVVEPERSVGEWIDGLVARLYEGEPQPPVADSPSGVPLLPGTIKDPPT